MGYGRVWVFPKTATVALMFKPTDEVQSILRRMSKAIDGLSGVEKIKKCEDLTVPILLLSSTEPTHATSINEAYTFKKRLSKAFPHGIRLAMARGLAIQEAGPSKTPPETTPFTATPPSSLKSNHPED